MPSGSATAAEGTRLGPYLPLALFTSLFVTALPVAAAALLVRSDTPAAMLAAAVIASALSLALGSAAAALWMRWRGSRDLVFADLLLWGWCRRYCGERRLGRARELYDSAREAGPLVSIELIERLSRLLEVRDASTQGHSRRVARHAGRIAEAMRLSPSERAKVRTAAAVHDVGKLYTPAAILNKPGALTDAEYEILKRHPVDGAEMLAHVGDREIAAMVLHHHERLDGSGYPDRLAGEQIPLGARIIAVADTFDAISSERVYRSARTHKKALDILAAEAGTQLDGAVVAAFMQSYSARRRLAGLTFLSAVAQRLLGWLQSSSASLGVGLAGVAPLVPALGAAGVLALSHAAAPARAHAAAGMRAQTSATGARTSLRRIADARARTAPLAPVSPTRHAHRRASVSPSGATRAPGAIPTVQTQQPAGRSRAPDTFSPPQVPSAAAVSAPSASVQVSESPSATGDSPKRAPVSVGAPSLTGVVPVSTAPVSSSPSTPVSLPSPTLPAVSSEEVSLSTPVVKVTVTTPTIEVPKLTLP